jgi:hypothetical protein
VGAHLSGSATPHAPSRLATGTVPTMVCAVTKLANCQLSKHFEVSRLQYSTVNQNCRCARKFYLGLSSREKLPLAKLSVVKVLQAVGCLFKLYTKLSMCMKFLFKLVKS